MKFPRVNLHSLLIEKDLSDKYNEHIDNMKSDENDSDEQCLQVEYCISCLRGSHYFKRATGLGGCRNFNIPGHT